MIKTLAYLHSMQTPHRPARPARVAPGAVLLAAFAALSSSLASAQIVKANNTDSLSLGSSYVGGIAPNSTQTLVTDATLTAARASNLGASRTIGGINHTSTQSFTINNTAGAVLTLGSSGITKAAGAGALTLNNAIALSANQTWTVTTGGGNLVWNSLSFSDGGNTLTVSGTGRLDLNPAGSMTLTDNVSLNAATVVVNNASAVVTLGNNSQTDNFQIIKGRAIGSALGNFGVASSFGDGGTSTAIIMGGGTAGDAGFFEYTGATASSNRTFNFDRRTTGSEIRNTNAASTLTLTGLINNNQGSSGFTANSAYSFGGAGNITLTGTEQLKDNTDATFTTTLNKNGTGTLTITGANSNSSASTGTFQGATNVNEGLLVVTGAGSINSTSGINVSSGAGFIYDSSTALTKAVTLASGARFGGDGSVSTNINIGSGVKVVFDPAKTLDVTGTNVITLATTFGLDDLVASNGSAIDWSSVGIGTYNLFNSIASISYTTIANLSIANSMAVTLDKNAYFQFADSESDLQLVVAAAIPEPAAFAALAGLAGLGLAATRRRRRA